MHSGDTGSKLPISARSLEGCHLLPRHDIAAVLKRLGIEGRLRGREWHARCPNKAHDDRHPSWRIRDEPGHVRHGFHNCYPCGFGGDLSDLVEHVLDLSWTETNAWLAGSQVEDTRPIAEHLDIKVRPVLQGFTLPTGVVVAPMADWSPSAAVYARGRGITPQQVDRWRIGYSVEGRLANRVVFVKRDGRGDGGYSARTFIDDRRRYLEPEPWECPRPVMFGEEHWPTMRADRQCLHLAEGVINALAIERALNLGFIAVTAGSQFHPVHALKLSSWKSLVVVSDPDAAGDKLATAIINILARHRINIRRVRLRTNQDAASTPTDELRQALACSTIAQA